MLGPPRMKAREQEAAVRQSMDGSIGLLTGGAIGPAYPERTRLATVIGEADASKENPYIEVLEIAAGRVLSSFQISKILR